MLRRLLLLALPALLALCPAGCGDGAGVASAGDRIRLAYVTNGVDPFWTIAAAGARAAAAEFGVECDVRMPADIMDQKRIVEDLLTRQVDGFAISPIDGVNQRGLIDEACAITRVITHDSDAPGSKRLCYVGMDNYVAGRMCGELVKEALPEGGKVMLFVGRVEQDNARRRRQGVIDELLGRPPDPARFDPPGQVLQGNGYTILATRTDQFDKARAKANAEDALAVHPDLGCMVGLFAYNTPACLEALKNAGKIGELAVCSFDEADETLQGVLDGVVHGTVVQQPFRYGYESVRILAALVRGEETGVPESGFVDVSARVIRAADAAAFRSELERLTGRGK